MASTVVEIDIYPGTAAKVWLQGRAGSTGTPNASGYTPTRVFGSLHTITVTEPLVGWFRLVAGTSEDAPVAEFDIELSDVASLLPLYREAQTVENISDTLNLLQRSRTLQSLESTSGAISKRRGDSWTISISSIGNISTRTEMWFTVKEKNTDKVDSLAVLLISESEGIEVLNGESQDTSGSQASTGGTITVTDASAGDIEIYISPEITSQLDPFKSYNYDLQWTDGTDVTTSDAGDFVVVKDISRRVS